MSPEITERLCVTAILLCAPAGFHDGNQTLFQNDAKILDLLLSRQPQPQFWRGTRESRDGAVPSNLLPLSSKRLPTRPRAPAASLLRMESSSTRSRQSGTELHSRAEHSRPQPCWNLSTSPVLTFVVGATVLAWRPTFSKWRRNTFLG